MNAIVQHLALGAVLLALGACGPSAPESVLGTYKSSGKCANEVLTLTSENKFMHTYGVKTTYAGAWTVEGKTITLAPFRTWVAPPEDRPDTDSVAAKISKAAMGDTITILIDGDCSFVRK